MKHKTKCKKYEIAITDYVMGEKMDMPQKELFKHLRQCKKCKEDFIDWLNTYAYMRTEAYHAQPKAQKRAKALFKRLMKEQAKHPIRIKRLPGEKVVNKEVVIGKPADVVWQHLFLSGKVKVTDLPKKTHLPPYMAYGAMGWLVMKDKAYISKARQNAYVYLSRD